MWTRRSLSPPSVLCGQSSCRASAASTATRTHHHRSSRRIRRTSARFAASTSARCGPSTSTSSETSSLTTGDASRPLSSKGRDGATTGGVVGAFRSTLSRTLSSEFVCDLLAALRFRRRAPARRRPAHQSLGAAPKRRPRESETCASCSHRAGQAKDPAGAMNWLLSNGTEEFREEERRWRNGEKPVPPPTPPPPPRRDDQKENQ